MHKRITESEMLASLSPGAVLLPPLVIHHCELFPKNRPHTPDAYLELGLPDSDERFRFILESKARATPQDVQLALAQARAKARTGERPMVQVPFLSPERLDELPDPKPRRRIGARTGQQQYLQRLLQGVLFHQR